MRHSSKHNLVKPVMSTCADLQKISCLSLQLPWKLSCVNLVAEVVRGLSLSGPAANHTCTAQSIHVPHPSSVLPMHVNYIQMPGTLSLDTVMCSTYSHIKCCNYYSSRHNCMAYRILTVLISYVVLTGRIHSVVLIIAES